MLIAHFTGDHSSEGWQSRIGAALTKLGQKGPYSNITHTEAIHTENTDGSVIIASASLRDGGVRGKRAHVDDELATVRFNRGCRNCKGHHRHKRLAVLHGA